MVIEHHHHDDERGDSSMLVAVIAIVAIVVIGFFVIRMIQAQNVVAPDGQPDSGIEFSIPVNPGTTERQ